MYAKRVALLLVLYLVAARTVPGQVPRTQPEGIPDVSNKALITKETPPAKATGPSPRKVPRYTIEQFMNTMRIGGASFAHDEKSILFHSNKSGIFNVYSVPVRGGEPKQLTSSTKESTYLLSAFPRDGRFLYTFDKGGNENSHIYLRELDGTERDLTPGDKTKANFHSWSEDRNSFFFSTNERDPKFFDIYEMKIADLSRSIVYQDETGYEFKDISNDRRYLAFEKPGISTADSDTYLYNTATKEMKNITAHEGEVRNAPADFSVDSKFLFYLSNEGSEFTYVVRHDLATGERSVVEKAPWDITTTYFSKGGKYRVTSINEDARTKVKIYDVASGKEIPLPALPEGDLTTVNISDSEKKISFYHNGSRSPSNLHVFEFGADKPLRLTDTLSPEIDPADLVPAQVVRFKSFDGLEIPGILYRPHAASAQSKVPAIVLVHGGPGGQARMPYYAVAQFLANNGYAVLDVNNRGSTGYGKSFHSADDRKHGREPLWDCVEAKNYLARQDYIEPSKIAIMGGSYGGYMTLAALAFKPEEFAAGVNIFGVSNWVRTLQSMPTYWESQRKALYREIGNPETDVEMLREISPLFHAGNITKPLIVLQGANDPRVIKPESDEIVDAIKKKNGVVEYVVFDDEGHGFSKKANEIRAYSAILAFLDKNVKAAGATKR